MPIRYRHALTKLDMLNKRGTRGRTAALRRRKAEDQSELDLQIHARERSENLFFQRGLEIKRHPYRKLASHGPKAFSRRKKKTTVGCPP